MTGAAMPNFYLCPYLAVRRAALANALAAADATTLIAVQPGTLMSSASPAFDQQLTILLCGAAVKQGSQTKAKTWKAVQSFDEGIF